MKDIPVILVCYNRPWHTLQVLKALEKHNIQNLYIFSDAPKTEKDQDNVAKIRELIKSIYWTKPEVIYQEVNQGLAKSIVGAANYVFQRHDRMILLEDDCVPQKYFFTFMKDCLEKYENNHRVFGISGYTVPTPEEILCNYPYDLYFFPRIGSWGWATWKRAWQKRGKDILELIDTAVKNGIDLNQGGTDIPIALDNILKGNVKDVWTLHWVLSVYLNNGVYVYPTRSHILNVGMDGTGIHCKTTNKYDTPYCDIRPINYPDEVFLDKDMMTNFRGYYDVGPASKAMVSSVTRPGVAKAAMKICYISAGDIKGGAQRVGWMLKQGLKQRGFQTAMFVKNKISNDPEVKIITDATLDSGTHYADQGYMYYDIKSTFRLNSQPEFSVCDVVHFHNLHGNYFNPFALPALTESKPSVWTLHDMNSMTGHCAYAFDCNKWQTGCGNCLHPESYPPITKDRTAEMWHDKKLIYKESDLELIVPSQWLKNIVEKSILKDKRVHLIYNGIDERIYRSLDKHAIRKMFKIPPNAVIISFVAHGGLIDKRKGGDFILEAHKYFTAKYPNVFFICIGGTSNKAPTERLLQIPFVLDEEKLVQLYCTSDIFLFPTLADNCPLVILEVMGCGVPIISFNTGGVPELIEHGKTGLIAGFKNSEEFIRMTEYLVTDRAKREEFGAASRERLLQMFTLEQMIDKHIVLYERLAEEGRKKNYVPPKNKVALPAATSDKQYKYLVSVIVSTYNSEKFIRGCLEDLENQTIADRLEIIVVNSGSQQNEDAIVREFQQQYDNIKYLKTEERETIYKAWNRAIKAASGKYITNANTDDRHRQGALEIMARALDENPDKAMVYANQLDANETDGRRVTVGERINGQFLRSRLFNGECPPGSQPMWRRDVHEVFGYFDESFSVSGDYEFWFRLTQKFDFLYLNEILGERYVGPETVSTSNTNLTSNLENMVIHKSYQYAMQEAITIGATGISEHPVLSLWPEVNIWKQNTKAKLEDRRMSLVDNIKDSWDFRTSLSPKLTIVIVAYNRHKELLENLYALNEQNEKDFEVIVIDNGGDLSWLKQHKDEFNFGLCGVELNLNFGPSPARNRGVEFAKAEYIAFLDDDAVADKHLVRNIVEHFENYSICGLRGKVLPKTPTDLQSIPVNYDLGNQIITTTCEVSCLSAFRKDVLAKTGGFDELLFGTEGMELSYRICKAQKEKVKSILYFPDVVVYHDPSPQGPAQTERKLRQHWMELLAWRKDNDITGYKELVHSLYPGNKAIFENNSNDYTWVINVALYLQKNFPEEAIEWAKKAVALRPDGFKGCYILGSLYIWFGRYDEALVLLERIYEPLRNSAMSGGSDFISSEFEEQVDISECYSSVCTQLAQCYMQTNQYHKLKQVYTNLLNNPNLILAEEQKADILNVLTKLDKTLPTPLIAEKKNNITVSAKSEQDYLVSAIVSTYNSEKFLRGCLEDLEQQTIADKLEIIVINSRSQENEEAIVREYQQKHNNIVYIETEQHEGIYTAWNRAIKVARGTFLTNANTDDRYREDTLEIMAETLLTSPDVALVYGDQICTDTPNGTFANHHAIEMARRAEYSHERLLFGCCVGSQPMWRKSLHAELGYFDDTLTCAGDWDFWLRISISSRYKFKHIPEFLGLYYYNENGIEHGRKIHSLYERYIVGKRYGNPYISVIPLYTSKDNPLVSVIMPAYNAADYVAEAIESILIQNYRNFELIVIDDGSTDNTKDIVINFKDDKIKYFYKNNGGPSGARNLAINKSKGQYIMPLDADDMMTPHFIAKHLAEFEKHPDVDLVYCDDCLINEDSKPIRVIERPEYTDRKMLIRDLFRCGFPVVPFRTCIKRSVFDKIGFFDENLRMAEDYDMIRRFVKMGLKIQHLPGALYLRRITPNSLSRNFTSQNAKFHFDVVGRFTDTFTCDELFPDVVWDEIAPQMRQLHAKCLTAGTYLAIGQDYVKTKATECSRTAFDLACSELNDCVKMDPGNQGLRQLLQKSKLIRARYTKAPQQLVSK